MNKQDIIRNLKVVCFDMIYSQVKEVLNSENFSLALSKLQKMIVNVDNLLRTIDDNVADEEINLTDSEVHVKISDISSEKTQEYSVDNSDVSKDNNVDEIKVETSQDDVATSELIQDKKAEVVEEAVVEKEDKAMDADSPQPEDKDVEESKTAIDYDLEEYYRLTNNPVKAIIVNASQLRKLRESLNVQKERLDFGVIAVTSNANTDVSNKAPSIEELLEQARMLYKEGKILESEKLYEQIRVMNKNA